MFVVVCLLVLEVVFVALISLASRIWWFRWQVWCFVGFGLVVFTGLGIWAFGDFGVLVLI